MLMCERSSISKARVAELDGCSLTLKALTDFDLRGNWNFFSYFSYFCPHRVLKYIMFSLYNIVIISLGNCHWQLYTMNGITVTRL